MINGTTKSGEALTTLLNSLITFNLYTMIFKNLNINYDSASNSGDVQLFVAGDDTLVLSNNPELLK